VTKKTRSYVSQAKSIRRVTGCGLYDWGSIPCRGMDYFFVTPSRPGLQGTHLSTQ